MKKTYLILSILCSVLLHSQNRSFINSDTRLYTETNTSSNFLGYFKYGAEVQLLSENKNGWYKVKADNLSEGYVPSKFIAKALNSSDNKVKDAENPIQDGDQFYGGNHLFVVVAGLKARALPDKNSKIKAILTTGEPIPVNYFPKNQEDWVNISGSFSEEYRQFTLRKFIGERPDFDRLIKEFDKLNVNAIEERKTIGERLVELSWHSESAKFAPAYKRYYEVVKQLNDPKLLADTELNMAIANGQAQYQDVRSILALIEKAEFVLKGVKTKQLSFTQKELVKFFGNPAKKESIGDECGVYLSDLFYYYKDLHASVDEKQNKAEMVKVFINENNKFVLNPKDTLDHTMTEKAFIDKFGSYIKTSNKTPHVYRLQLEDSEFSITFKDGKIFTVELFYFC